MTGSSAVRVVRAQEGVRRPWLNGHGWTTEIACLPDNPDWQWRISIAESDRAAPFSSYPGIDRELVLLSGAGLRLRFEDGELCELRTLLAGHRFAGERNVIGEPVDGPTRQLNLMWRRGTSDPDVLHHRVDRPTPLVTGPATEWAVVVASGGVQVGIEGREIGLEAGDALVVSGDEARTDCHAGGSGDLLLLLLARHQDL